MNSQSVNLCQEGTSGALCRGLYLALIGVLACAAPATANNLNISNTVLTGQDVGSDFILVQFDLSWDNSWRVASDPGNWDAAWVFVKYRVAGGDWAHATLNTSGHTAPSGSTIDTAADGTGVFAYRSAAGSGTLSLTDVELRWNYGTDGLTDNAVEVDVQVYAIEMVYVPEGAFAAGSGGSETAAFTLTTINTATATTAPTGSGSLGGKEGGYPEGQTAPNTSNWPNGYSAFYIQKYEITQGQYADFLNLLTSTQAGARGASPLQTDYRFTITESGGVYTAGVPDRAANYLNWADGTAYADWAGLRPMTELEFEKAARGTALPVADEYAWGSTKLHATDYTLSNDGASNATVSNLGGATGNAWYSVVDDNLSDTARGPLRAGVFAASTATPSRAESGASFYGVMELSGNLFERAVGLAFGPSFDGTHGDGSLTSAGEGDASTWPGGYTIGGRRGGGWNSSSGDLRISDRKYIQTATHRGVDYGFRAVRSAP